MKPSDLPFTTVNTDDDVTKRLAAEVHDPAHLNVGRIDVDSLHAGQTFQLLVGVVSLMLQSGGQGDHGQVVGIHDGVDVAGETQREGGQGNALCQTTAGGRALDVHGRSAGGLADGGAYALADFAQTLYQAHGRGGFTFAQGGRGDGGYIDILSVGVCLSDVPEPS